MGSSCEVRYSNSRRCLRGLMFMLAIFLALTEVSADFTDLFVYYENKVLPSHDDELIGGITPEECAQKCLEGTTTVPEGECLSFDYWKVQGRCQLSRNNKGTSGQALGFHSQFDHYEMKDIVGFFAVYADQALPQHDDVIVSPATVSPRTCALRCLLGEGSLSVGSCLSFDLDSSPDRCLLSRDNQETAGQALGNSTRFDHYQRNEICVPNPCVHVHESCTNEANGYTCTCDTGWEGDTCDTFTGIINPQNCADLSAIGFQTSGTYHVGHPQPFPVSCDMNTDGGGWTVIQRRQDGSVPFNNTWDVVVQGFGDVSGEFWLGLNWLHNLTTQAQSELYIRIEDWERNSRYARYSEFSVRDSDSKYAVTISGYSGDVGDDLTLTASNGRHNINGREFSTKDQDNDDNTNAHCAADYGQGGWWYPASCGWAMLNNRYLTGCSTTNPPSCPTAEGIVWYSWKTYEYSLKETTMMIRPVNFPSSSLDTCQNGGTMTLGTPGSGVYTCVCPAGFGWTYCEQACTAGEFGPGCYGTCHCASGDSVCDVITGVCSIGGCEAGWKGSDCQTACSPGEFDPGCTGTCHCADGGSVCDVMTGVCSSGGCEAGWKGYNCQTPCNQSEFGPGCTGTCHCAGGNSACNIQTGACSGGCAAGWTGNDCQTACNQGEFGPGCTGTCHCAGGNSTCNIQTGACTGGCAAGWKGDDCQTDIDECNAGVDNCHIYATCSNTEGSFNCSCNPGYQGNGTSCTEQKVAVAGLPLVGIIAGTVAGIVAIGAVGAVVFYCRRMNKNIPKQRDVPLKHIGDQLETGCARNEAFHSENGSDTTVSERLSNLTTVADVQAFLIKNGLQEYARAFKENDVDGKALRHLDETMMKDLVPMVGPRARLKAVLEELNGSTGQQKQVSSESPISTLNFWEIPRSSLKLGRRLGRGQFGEVRLGEVRNRGVRTRVAVKTLRDSASDSDKKDLLGELEILVTVGRHDNIISLVGACTTDGPLMIVVEYAPNGCLKDWLKTSVENNAESEYQNQSAYASQLSMEQLIQFGVDVASGMSHLAVMQCIHRDLAARNILLGENLVAKVSDFGLSRDIYEDSEYVKSTQSKLPLRWMANESLFYNVYTTQSDVWSFGVLLWEIMTMGKLPYEGMKGKRMMDMIKDGGRLEKPNSCPDEIYTLMTSCWETLPEDRPTFPALRSSLIRIIQGYKTYASLLK